MAIDFSTLKLVEREERHDTPDSELGEDWVDEDAIRQAQWFRDVHFDIVDPTSGVLGSFRFWRSDFAATLFDDEGKLKRKYAREGTGVWGREVTDTGNIVYLENIRVDEELRNQGIGSWALKEIFRSRESTLSEIDFLFAMPCVSHSDWPYFDRFEPDPNRQAKLDMNKRVDEFFRRNGYRRVGTTEYFCSARDPSHPSYAIRSENDAAKAAETDPVNPGNARLFEVMARLNGR
ncbi:hypothetical protein JCM10207_000746 [Rhodosporidiobolus poonsookiae]